MHQDEVKVFRGNVETHLMRLKELSWRSGEYVAEPTVGPEVEGEPLQVAPPLPEVKKPWPVSIRALLDVLMIVGKRIWIVAIGVAALLWLMPNFLFENRPLALTAGGCLVGFGCVLAWRKARRERDVWS